MATDWGNTIFQSASEIANNEYLRQKVADQQAQGKADREWWDKEKASIQSSFMKELEQEKATGTGAGAGTPKSTTPAAEKGGSDEDTVLVEGGGPASSGSAAGSKGSAKKRKGKK